MDVITYHHLCPNSSTGLPNLFQSERHQGISLQIKYIILVHLTEKAAWVLVQVLSQCSKSSRFVIVEISSICRLPQITMDYLCILVIILPLLAVSKYSIATRAKLWSTKCSIQNKLMVLGLEQGDGSFITPMALAHPLHPVRSRSRNKCRKLRVGWCVSSWRHWICSICSIYYLGYWDRLFLRNIYIRVVGVLDVMILVLIFFLLVSNVCFKCICVPFTNSLVEFYVIMITITTMIMMMMKK